VAIHLHDELFQYDERSNCQVVILWTESGQEKSLDFTSKPLISLVRNAGIEPATFSSGAIKKSFLLLSIYFDYSLFSRSYN
jgi:hypothetical protein